MQIKKPCPSCRQPPSYSKLSHRHVLNQYQSYPTKGCPFSTCDQSSTKLPLESLLSHLLTDCAHIPLPCPLKCDFTATRSTLESHLCPNQSITCMFCDTSHLRKHDHQCVKSLQYLLDVEREQNKVLQGKLQEINSLNTERF